jgi:DNA polymerase III delta subunit
MLYLLYGTDGQKARKKLNFLIESMLSKKKDAMLLRINNGNFSPREVVDLSSTQGLFESKSIIVFDSIFENTTDKGILLDNLKNFQKSENIFILLEGKLDKKTVTKISKCSEKVQEFELPQKSDKKSSFNIFELSDALGEKDRKRLWVLYQTGKTKNISDEEMHGILFWSTKNMLLSKNSKNANEAGLSPFVYGKASKFSKNFREGELEEISASLLELYHKARRGIKPFDVSLEQFVLTLK